MPSNCATPRAIEACRPRQGCFAVVTFVLASSVGAAPIDDLRTLVESGRSDEAYATFCTDPDISTRPAGYDLWCGVAAVDLGRPGEGVLSLERHVLQFPDDVRARLELARAYFYAGDNVRSREEFEAVAKDR